MTPRWDTIDRYMIVSADGHAGADLRDYRPYLAARWHDEFDAWADSYVSPWGDLVRPDADRNWSHERRSRELDIEGVAAEVLFPNTTPPFFPAGSLLLHLPTTREDYERRWAGLQAHNRWLAEFCAQYPGRRGGIYQIMLNDLDDAIAEIRWAKEQPGLNGGVLLPGVSPDHPSVPALYDDCYEPLWQVCAELDVPINHHSGAGLPQYGMKPAARAVQLVEIPIFSHRALWHLIFAGVFERHPTLKLILTEQGTGWIPNGLASLDWFMGRMMKAGSSESMFGGEAVAKLSMLPSEYFARNCFVGASFIRPIEADLRHLVGVDRIMWGSDYPHSEGTAPYTREALRASFANAAVDECRLMFGKTAADVYGFDVTHLARIAAEIGPEIEEIHRPLHEFPSDTHCGAFDLDAIVRSW
jgi:predicted TIM-barrel fold metal-dependent hydrolase